MDTSKEYIKMCDCEEIQNNWKPKEDDLYAYIRFLPLDKSIYLYCTRRLNPEEIKKATWLPQQDQLQEMVDTENYTPEDLLNMLYFYCIKHNGRKDNTEKAQSMEQLWLAFVMKEKHNKTWDGNRWI